MPIEATPAAPLLPSRTFDHERVANEIKHWVRLTAACNSKCVFCLDAEAQDGRFMPFEDIQTEIRRGREEKDATRLVVSGGEGSIHPRFHDAIRYGKEAGYRWVQTVTNGQKLADRAFFHAAMDAGLDEITFSLHGHTPALHDRLTRTKNGFDNLMKAMMRAVRDGRCVVNVDVCINKQNVEHLEAIVALCARVGVKEFDLLHVIPQGVAWDNRADLFYDPEEHRDALRRVFRLSRSSQFHIWTNRFPVSHLEDMEELIQDPHKMLDEVGGRRTQFRRYLDEGTAIDCRDKERCPHCFIEPFCSALDKHVADHTAARFDVWWVGDPTLLGRGASPPQRPPDPAALPGGARLLGVSSIPADPHGPLYLRADRYTPDGSLVSLAAGSRIVATLPEHLGPLLHIPLLHAGVEVEVHLDLEMCAALQALPSIPSTWILHAPTRATAELSATLDPDWRAFFGALPAGTRAQNLPACLAPGAHLERPLRILDASLFHDDGRRAIEPFVDRHIEQTYRVKSSRCRACPADNVCEGAHIQSIRAHGFRQLVPLTGDTAEVVRRLEITDVSPRLRDGAPPLPASPRVPVPGNEPVPFIDLHAGRRS
ncbi:MAG: radical SAM protein [Pseudomonadota bacterium]|nr:radical SAM protein [Pseudomonadota bacterium]